MNKGQKEKMEKIGSGDEPSLPTEVQRQTEEKVKREYYKCVVRPSRPRSFFRTKKWQDICDIRSERSKRKKAIIGQYDASFAANDRVSNSFAADDRVSRDLNIPFH